MTAAELWMSLELGLIYGIVSVGIYLTFRVLDFPDLTCDGSFVFGAAVSTLLIKESVHPLLALLAAFMAGGLAGSLTCLLHTHLKIINLLAGILVAYMLYSLNLRVMSGVPNIALIHEQTVFTDLNPIFVLLVISGIVWAGLSFFLNSDFGLGLRSLGQNKRLALNCGVGEKGAMLIGLMLSNALIGMGGGLFSQHQGFLDISQGVGSVIMGLAAVMIGERLIPMRSPWILIFACLLGSVVYRVLVALALHSDLLGLQAQDLNLVTGLLIIGVVFIPKKGGSAC